MYSPLIDRGRINACIGDQGVFVVKAANVPDLGDKPYSKSFADAVHKLILALTSIEVNFSNLLDGVMPGIQNVLKNQKDNHKLTEFVDRYFHFRNILDMGEKEFTADYCKWAKEKGYRCNERKAAEIFALAQNGIPTLPNSESVKIAVSEAVKVIHSIEESRNTILSQMLIICKPLPEFSVAVICVVNRYDPYQGKNHLKI